MQTGQEDEVANHPTPNELWCVTAAFQISWKTLPQPLAPEPLPIQPREERD